RPGLVYAATYRHDADEARGLTISYGARVEREELKVDLTGDFTSESDFDRNSASGFAEIVARPSQRLTLLFGSRWEKYEELDSEITPRASAVVEAIPGVLSLSAAWGQAYKVPNLQQQFDDNPFLASNPDLKPETSESWEVGIDLTSRDRRATVSVTFFDQDFENLIREVAQEGSTKQIKRNLGAAKARGVEWSVRVRPSRHWTAGTEGAWVETKILDNTGLSGDEFPVGEELPFRPDVVGSVFVDLAPHPRFNAHVRVTRYGEQTVLRERFSGLREDIDSYVLTSLVLNYQASSRLTLYSRVGNLFDVDYETAFDRRGVPVNAVVGFKITN
ncbi:MAG: TonB-dependent receptor, partial [Gemmatimonadetes bacterium]|nr:TonB-dependent receptor [Gemmatimonadota bacterium]